MPASLPAEILRIHISEADRFHGKPLYEAIVARCRELQIAGATVFRGLEGYGEHAELHKQPIIVTVVDAAAKIDRLIPELAGMIDSGMMARSSVDMVRVRKTA
jgi:uncharacterized protein